MPGNGTFLQANKLKYGDSVDVLKINADVSPEVLKTLGVMGIPTVIDFAGGKEILRRTWKTLRFVATHDRNTGT